MSSAGRTQVVDVTYDDPRTGERVRERRVQEVPWEQIEEIRGQELALFRPPNARARADRRDERDYYGGRAYDDDYAHRPSPRDQLAPPVDDRYDDRYARRSVDRQRSRRRDDRSRRRRRRDDYSDSDSESSRERRHRRRHRRAKSEASSKKAQDDDGDNSPMWYSGRPRREAKWHERNFDSSYDGIIAAAAGAALGGITARHFIDHQGGDDKNKSWKIAGGVLAGAAAFNMAENKYSLYTEEKEEEREAKGKRRKADDVQLDKPMLLGGQMVAGGMLPGM